MIVMSMLVAATAKRQMMTQKTLCSATGNQLLHLTEGKDYSYALCILLWHKWTLHQLEHSAMQGLDLHWGAQRQMEAVRLLRRV